MLPHLKVLGKLHLMQHLMEDVVVRNYAEGVWPSHVTDLGEVC